MLRLDEQGRPHLSPLERLEEPASLLRLRERTNRMLLRIDLPELLLEVDAWTGFTSAFTHASDAEARTSDLAVSVCAVLVGQACNVGLVAVTNPAVPALRRGRLAWVAHHYLRAETITAANAALVDHQTTIPLAQAWGGGQLASADGLRFVVPVRTVNAGPNPRYFGTGRGVAWLNYLSDQVTGFAAVVVAGTIRDSLYILDGLLEQETGLQPEVLRVLQGRRAADHAGACAGRVRPHRQDAGPAGLRRRRRVLPPTDRRAGQPAGIPPPAGPHGLPRPARRAAPALSRGPGGPARGPRAGGERDRAVEHPLPGRGGGQAARRRRAGRRRRRGGCHRLATPTSTCSAATTSRPARPLGVCGRCETPTSQTTTPSRRHRWQCRRDRERTAPLHQPRRLRQYRLARAHAFPCTRCGQWKIARLVAEVDGDPARRLCNACYGQALAADPSGNTIPT